VVPRQEAVRFGIDVPQRAGTAGFDIALFRGFCERADRAGVDSLWVHQGALSRAGELDPLTTLAAAAVVTTNAMLGTAVLLSPLHAPVTLAATLKSVDQISGGRVIAGLGLGPSGPVYPAMGISEADRAQRFTELLTLLRACLGASPVSATGRFWTLRDASTSPPPVRAGGPPIVLGGGAPGALDRAARLADGWIGAGGETTQQFGHQLVTMRAKLEAHGRDPTSFLIAKRVYVSIAGDRTAALERIRPWFADAYGNASLADTLAVAGTVDECIDAVGDVVALGPDLVILSAPFDPLGHLDLLVEELLPRDWTR
jgi:alkanesulfonate monooxygenase SsuD/methylene tetrahydromethanopterin reductase-like flavin-dependent oxidoreductase (luciferase family)